MTVQVCLGFSEHWSMFSLVFSSGAKMIRTGLWNACHNWGDLRRRLWVP